MTRSTIALRTATAAAVALLLGACSGGDEPAGSPSVEASAAAPDAPSDTETRCASFDNECEEVLAPDTVEARGILFRPDELTVEVGTTVTWVNMDTVDHTVTAGDGEAPDPDRFDLSLPEQGSEVTFTFDEPGTYAYFCVIHPSTMTGTVTVE